MFAKTIASVVMSTALVTPAMATEGLLAGECHWATVAGVRLHVAMKEQKVIPAAKDRDLLTRLVWLKLTEIAKSSSTEEEAASRSFQFCKEFLMY